MWRALIAGVVLQHASMQSLLRELGRNLLEICGFDPLAYQSRPVTALHDGYAVTRAAAFDGATGTSRGSPTAPMSSFTTSAVSCVCPETGEVRAMAFQGFEADRGGTLKYRCPAAAFDLDCKGRDACRRAGGVKPGA